MRSATMGLRLQTGSELPMAGEQRQLAAIPRR